MHPTVEKLYGLISILHQKTITAIESNGLDVQEKFPLVLIHSFLDALTNKNSEKKQQALHKLKSSVNDPTQNDLAELFLYGLDIVKDELANQFPKEIKQQISTENQVSAESQSLSDEVLREKLYAILFPEGTGLLDTGAFEENIARLRARRKIVISELNTNPISRPAEEIIFTSNVLLTKPLSDMQADNLSQNLKSELNNLAGEPQKYWYDHPIPLGITLEKNEAIYGIRGLEAMLEYEKTQERMEPDLKLTCILSVSTTHTGLQKLVKQYIEEEFQKIPDIKHLNLYIFTETQTRQIVKDILIPLAKRYFPESEGEHLFEIFGVDGEYGRHYSFLKAIAPLWQILLETNHRATFKIDLDQVFPQGNLQQETGESAFEHFCTPLWGATGKDFWDNDVTLSMIAGALVNESDISKSIFTPDVTFPDKELATDENIFFSRLPQALSTQAEMMTRYISQNAGEHNKAIQRIHVTGGTNGILIDALRKYRPFTMSLFGRAEDQAYLFSVLFDGENNLRYLHKPGLIMRHDKKSFAVEAIKAASTGKLIGDYIRILLFSSYAKALPWTVDKIKEQVDPFTGCFVSKIPNSLVLLRFAFKILDFYVKNDLMNASRFAQEGAARIIKTMKYLNDPAEPIASSYTKEKQAWNLYYDLLDALDSEPDIKLKTSFCKRFEQICSSAKINFSVR